MSIRWVDTPRTLTHFEKPAATVAGFDNELGTRQRTGAARRRTLQHAADRRLQLGLHDARTTASASSTNSASS